MWRRLVVVSAVLGLVACDADGDGLSNSKEKKYGTDPDVVDSDGDGLTDGDEVYDYLTDPADSDTDGDGYLDGHEVDFGSDPLDDLDMIYAGGWPYNPDKDALEDPGDTGVLLIGERVFRFETYDQYEEMVDFYDFSGQGVPVMVDIAAEWCGPCRALSQWLDGGPDQMNLSPRFDPIRDAVEDGDLIWVTILGENNFGGYPAAPADTDDDGEFDASGVDAWAADFPNPHVPVLADNSELGLVEYFQLPFWPSVYLLDENLELVSRPNNNTWLPAMNAALLELEGE